MDRTVEGYLAELRTALAGADPALAQDALYDAEEYLRDAIAEHAGDPGAAFDSAVDRYGTPEEIASAYRDAELTVAAALRKPAAKPRRSLLGRFFGVVVDPVAWGAMLYMLLGLATGILYFTLVVTGVSLTAGLAVLIIGLPFALLFLAIVRAISLAEGRVVEGLLGVRMPRRPRTVGVRGDVLARIKSWLADYRTWTTMLYMVLQLPLGITYFSMLVTGIATSLGVIALPILQVMFDEPMIRTGAYGYWIEPYAFPLLFAAGILGLVLMLWLAKGVGYLHGAYAKVMLVGRGSESATGAVAPSMATTSAATAATVDAPAAPGANGGEL